MALDDQKLYLSTIKITRACIFEYKNLIRTAYLSILIFFSTISRSPIYNQQNKRLLAIYMSCLYNSLTVSRFAISQSQTFRYFRCNSVKKEITWIWELTIRSRWFGPNRAHAFKLLVHPRTYPSGRPRRSREAKSVTRERTTDRRFGMQPSGTRRPGASKTASFGSHSTWCSNGRAESNEGMSREQFKQFRLI